MVQKMEKQYQSKQIKKSGFIQISGVYQAKRCEGCPLRGAFHKSKTNRIIQVDHKLKEHRNKARAQLLSEKGLAHRSQRPVDVEAVFGNIKQNKKITRFSLRGLEKVSIEAGLIALAHNSAKMAKQMTSNNPFLTLCRAHTMYMKS